jgi:ATP-dependent dihydroxyacetone kinase
MNGRGGPVPGERILRDSLCAGQARRRIGVLRLRKAIRDREQGDFMRKFVNDPRAVVREMLEGLTDLAPDQALLAEESVVLRANLPPPTLRTEVAVLSGGGSGHEPAHAGYVGRGMLHAAIAGDVFTSPSADAVLAAIRAVAGPPGALLVVKNYTGDRLNFGLAAEMARAEGIPCEIAIVADDVALRERVEPRRRRGIAGTILVHKIAGAAAAAGLGLDEVAREARAAADAVGTMGVALGACIVPAAAKPGFTLAEGEVELGLGIHGEPGVRRVTGQSADALVDTMLGAILEDRSIGAGDRVALLVNGLGGTPPMELAIVARRALAVLRDRKIVVERAWSGSFLTALEMPGCSLSILQLDAQRLMRLDAPSSAPAWPGGGRIAERRLVPPPAPAVEVPAALTGPLADRQLHAAARAVAAALEAAEPRLTALDSAAGDGDLGLSMTRGATALRALPEAAWANPAAALTILAGALRRAIAGSSGPFYATALLRSARTLPQATAPGAADWARALQAAVAAVAELGGARPGDRSMLDALHPAAVVLGAALARGASPGHALAEAAAAAEAGVEATARMHPRVGRASYLGERAIGTPDGGAAAVAIWLRAIADVVQCSPPASS